MNVPPFFFRDYHVHTRLSPCARDEMVLDAIIERAAVRGYCAIGIADHAYSRTIDEIHALHEAVASRDYGIDVRVGCEVGVKVDGTLDVADELLAGLDYVIGAPTHPLQFFDPDAATPEERAEQVEQWFRLTSFCCEHPVIDVIAHPLRGLGGSLAVDSLAHELPADRLDGLFARLRRTGIGAMELTDWLENYRSASAAVRRFYRAAVAHGFQFAAGSDAHGLDRLGSQISALWLHRELGLEETQAWRPGPSA